MSTVPSPESVRATPPIAKQVPTERTHHGDTVTDPVRLAHRSEGPRGHRLPGGGERLHGGADRGARRAAVRGVRRDQGAHPGDRPVGAGAQGELVAVLAHRGGSAVRDPLPPPGARRRGHPADAGGRQAARRRGGAARRERARRGQGVLLARRAVGVSPDEQLLAYSTDFAGDERFTLRIKDLVTGEVLDRRGAGHVLRLRLVARRVGPVLRHGRRGVAAVPGLAAHRRDALGRRRGGVRGERREVLARRRDSPATRSG